MESELAAAVVVAELQPGSLSVGTWVGLMISRCRVKLLKKVKYGSRNFVLRNLSCFFRSFHTIHLTRTLVPGAKER